ncbi:hypothetical protein ACQR0Z_02335 [Bradyrhizobium sp. HKCCYLS3077]|uniref:hypothetical protein n=1 Tax=Bradyrhizobium sp. HKCCYLS3077 TaxID=3420761 RepID=UPI003EB701F7
MVLKILSCQITHKSDVGRVAVNLQQPVTPAHQSTSARIATACRRTRAGTNVVDSLIRCASLPSSYGHHPR